MAARLIRLPRPGSEDDEHRAEFKANHGCSQGRALRGELGREADEVSFPVGMFGYGFPIGIPFEVTAGHECPACGAWLRIWAEWTGPKIWVP